MKALFHACLLLLICTDSCWGAAAVSYEDQLAIAMALSENDDRVAPLALVAPRAPLVIDFASEDLARRLADKEQESLDLIAALTLGEGAASCTAVAPMDKATAALIAALTLEDAHPSPTGGFHECPTVQRVLLHKDVATHRATLAPIVKVLSGISQGSNVHVLDAHVVANIGKLHAMGEAFGVDNPALTAPEMRAYLLAHSDFYKGYERQAVTKAQLTQHIDAALKTASLDGSVLRMYSRIVSLIQRLDREGMDSRTYLQLLFDAISENYLTQGGCPQGVRNRAYIRYVSLLNTLMGA